MINPTVGVASTLAAKGHQLGRLYDRQARLTKRANMEASPRCPLWGQSGVGLTDGVRRSSERREANGRPMTSAALQAVKGYTTRRLTNGGGAAVGFTPAASNRGREANTKRVSGLTTDKPQSRQLRPVRQP